MPLRLPAIQARANGTLPSLPARTSSAALAQCAGLRGCAGGGQGRQGGGAGVQEVTAVKRVHGSGSGCRAGRRRVLLSLPGAPLVSSGGASSAPGAATGLLAPPVGANGPVGPGSC